MKKTVHKLLPETVNTKIAYPRRKLSTSFQIKNKSKFDHQHGKCIMQSALESYVTKIT